MLTLIWIISRVRVENNCQTFYILPGGSGWISDVIYRINRDESALPEALTPFLPVASRVGAAFGSREVIHSPGVRVCGEPMSMRLVVPTAGRGTAAPSN